MISDGGALLLRETDLLFAVTGRLARYFVDYCDPGRTRIIQFGERFRIED